jgi:hypothetical protein
MDGTAASCISRQRAQEIAELVGGRVTRLFGPGSSDQSSSEFFAGLAYHVRIKVLAIRLGAAVRFALRGGPLRWTGLAPDVHGDGRNDTRARPPNTRHGTTFPSGSTILLRFGRRLVAAAIKESGTSTLYCAASLELVWQLVLIVV